VNKTTTLEAPAGIGHNAEPDPFTAHQANIADLYEEARGWLDGAEITNAKQAEAVQTLLDMIKDAHEAADASRVEENKPFDEGKAAVQAKYAPLLADTKTVTGLTVRAKAACLAVLTKWRVAERARQDALAAEARRVAELAATTAAQAARDAAGDLQATEAAEQLVTEAQTAQRAAKTAAAPVRGLRDHWEVMGCNDESALLKHYWTTNRQAIVDAALELARVDVRTRSIRTIPGVVIENHPRAT
jgi:type IV secretory pathway VirB10-like protein